MSTKRLPKGDREGKAEGSKGKRQAAPKPSAEAVAYARQAYAAALAHFEATQGEPGIPVFYKTMESDAKFFAEYQRDGRFFAGILASPDCPQQFRDLFAAVFGDMCDAAHFTLGHQSVLPLSYAVVRDICDAQNYCGNADGLHDALIYATEVLVPDSIANASREAMKRE
jgi:hypothetical protein